MNASSGTATKCCRKTKMSKIDNEAMKMPACASSAMAELDSVDAENNFSRPCQKMFARKNMRAKTVTVYVNCDIGWGNKMFIRGEGACLSWTKGMQMMCMANDMWMWTCETMDDSIAFKVLINDEMWCMGDNYSMDVGAEMTIMPEF